jgi:DNA repair protein RadC
MIVMLLRLTETRKTDITSPDDIFAIMSSILRRKSPIDRNREHLWSIGLDHGNRVLYIEQVSVGCIDTVIAHPMEIFCMAVRKRCTSIILIHNHSISPEPSRADILLTEKMQRAGELLSITLLDHLIITTEDYYSFASEGQLKPAILEPLSRRCNNFQHPFPGFFRYFNAIPSLKLLAIPRPIAQAG